MNEKKLEFWYFSFRELGTVVRLDAFEGKLMAGASSV